MKMTGIEAANSTTYTNNREFACGLVEVTNNRIKLNLNSEFLGITESSIDGIIPLDAKDEVASIDIMRAAADFFTELAQNLRQAARLYDSRKPGADTAVKAEDKTKNQHQQAEHLEMIHIILEKLPEEEKTLYQGFGFGERARLYKLVGDETDPVNMQELICKKIREISAGKGREGI